MKGNTTTIKIKKGDYLEFGPTNRTEQIIKSSNNDSNGMIKTFLESKKMDKEYSVKYIKTGIKNGSIRYVKVEELNLQPAT
jgi:hypothetical protein